MATTPFHLSIVTPETTVYEGEATSVTLPGADGYIGIWAHHAPMVAGMRPGVLRFHDVTNSHQELCYAVGGGFAEVSDNKVIVLVDFAEEDAAIDLDAARAELARAKERLHAALRDKDLDADEAEEEAARAEARLKAAYSGGTRE